jgi:uncharacterized Fe-S cluster-containing radical SAM superfamily protein
VTGVAELIEASRPRSPDAHLVTGDGAGHLFLPDGSRLFDLDPDLLDEVEHALETGAVTALLDRLQLREVRYIDDAPLDPPPVHALSLAVAQACNLACTYCYAQGGEFGGTARSMPLEVAERSVDMLVGGAAPGARLNLAFLGGEPLVNRDVLQAATRRARAMAAERGIEITFSITTNGTLLTAEDAQFFEEHGFAVTVSLDGPREAHDAQRPFRGGRSSYDVIMRNVAPLLALQRRMQVSARVTVARRARRRGLPQRRLLGDAELADGPRRAAAGGSRGDAGADGRLRARVRASRSRRPPLPVREPRQCAPGDRPRHTPAVSLRRRRRIPRRVGRRIVVGVSPLRR